MRDAVVGLVSGIAALCAGILCALYKVRALSFLTASRLAALPAGGFGVRLRRHWYRMTLASCGSNLVVEWLSTFKTPEARVGSNVFVGAMCWIAEANLQDDVMIGARTAIQGGARTHTFERIDVPMNQQPPATVTITIGPDVWIGTGATVMADVSPGTIVGAGAVVTRSFPPRSIVAGVPARVVRERGSGSAGSMNGIPLVILGAGTFAIEVLEAAQLAGGFRPLGFVVSDQSGAVEPRAGLPVHHEEAIPADWRDAHVICGIVTSRRRPFVERMESRGWRFTKLLHPAAIVSPRASIEDGAFVGAGAIVASNARVGRHVLLNRGSNIGHDVRLGAFATVSPGATLAGAVHVGAGAYIGVGAAIRDHLSVGDAAVIAAGAVVVKPVDPNVMVAGCPAAIIKRGVDGL